MGCLHFLYFIITSMQTNKTLQQLHISEIFATIESIGLVVRGLNLRRPRQPLARVPFATPSTAALHWVPLVVPRLDLLPAPL